MEPGFFQITLKVFLCHQDRLLILRDRISGVGDLPGGRISKAEFYADWQDCLARELREELGEAVQYRLDPEPLFVFPHFIESAGEEALGIAYQAQFIRGQIQLSDEHDKMQWVALHDLEPGLFFSTHYARAVSRFKLLRSKST